MNVGEGYMICGDICKRYSRSEQICSPEEEVQVDIWIGTAIVPYDKVQIFCHPVPLDSYLNNVFTS